MKVHDTVHVSSHAHVNGTEPTLLLLVMPEILFLFDVNAVCIHPPLLLYMNHFYTLCQSGG